MSAKYSVLGLVIAICQSKPAPKSSLSYVIADLDFASIGARVFMFGEIQEPSEPANISHTYTQLRKLTAALIRQQQTLLAVELELRSKT